MGPAGAASLEGVLRVLDITGCRLDKHRDGEGPCRELKVGSTLK